MEKQSLLPAVVFNANNKKLDVDLLEHTFERFSNSDDVFTFHFTNGGVLLPQNMDPEQSQDSISRALKEYLSHRSAQLLFMKPSDTDNLPEGPYFLHGESLHQAWRLYSDDLESFTTGVMPDDEGVPYRYAKRWIFVHKR